MRIAHIFIIIGICLMIMGNEFKYAERINEVDHAFTVTHSQSFKEVHDLINICKSARVSRDITSCEDYIFSLRTITPSLSQTDYRKLDIELQAELNKVPKSFMVQLFTRISEL